MMRNKMRIANKKVGNKVMPTNQSDDDDANAGINYYNTNNIKMMESDERFLKKS